MTAARLWLIRLLFACVDGNGLRASSTVRKMQYASVRSVPVNRSAFQEDCRHFMPPPPLRWQMGLLATKHTHTLSASFSLKMPACLCYRILRADSKIWAGRAENFLQAVDMAGRLAKANATAQLGKYEGPHPSVCRVSTLHDPNRGWRPPHEELVGVPK